MYQPDWKSFRQSLSLSQEQFGARIGANKDRVSYVERISRTYRPDELSAIEIEFGALVVFVTTRGGVPAWFEIYEYLSPKQQAAADEIISTAICAIRELG